MNEIMQFTSNNENALSNSQKKKASTADISIDLSN